MFVREGGRDESGWSSHEAASAPILRVDRGNGESMLRYRRTVNHKGSNGSKDLERAVRQRIKMSKVGRHTFFFAKIFSCNFLGLVW